MKARCCLLAGALVVAGCGSSATAMVVSIDAELGVLADSARLRVVVR